MLDHRRAVSCLDCWLSGTADSDRLSPATEASVLMRLNDAGGHDEISFGDGACDRDWDSLAGWPQTNHSVGVKWSRGDHSITRGYVRAKEGLFLIVCCRAMEADPNDDRDLPVSNAGLSQLVEQRRHQDVIWARTGRIGDDDDNLVG